MPDFNLYLGNCLDVLRDLPAESVDSIVTDPPYGLTQNKKGGTGAKSVNLNNPAGRSRISTGNGAGGFMGKKWDSNVPSTEIWAECLRVLKPGGNLLCFAGTRTQHRMVARVVEAGFELQDMVLWAYGCLSEDTEVLTKEGWVLHSEAIGKDIQIFDIVTKECKWETPSQWYTYEVENDVAYSLRSEDTDQIVSKGHRCLVCSDDSLSFTIAEELREAEVVPVLDEHGALHRTQVAVSEISYFGTFWCPTVSTGAFVARRNGKVFITGNSGFPKSLSISKAIRADEKRRWLNVYDSINNVNTATVLSLWKEYSNTAISAGISFLREEIKVGQDTQKVDFAPENVVLQINPENKNAVALIADLISVEAPHTGKGSCSFVQSSVESNTMELRNHVTIVEKPLENLEVFLLTEDFSVLQSAWDCHGEKMEGKLKAVEALKTWLGKKSSLKSLDTAALCAALTDDLKLIILNQSKTFQSYGTSQQMDCVSAMTVIITEYMAERLISFTVDTLKRMAAEEMKELDESGGMSPWEGYGTSIKPAHEIISIYTKLPGDFNLHNEFKRLYYCAKASKRERNLGLVDRVSTHPTIKPLKLMKQLCELATPKGGTILDPFMGSGTTGIAALSSGFDFIGIDITPEYFEIASLRLNSLYPQSK